MHSVSDITAVSESLRNGELVLLIDDTVKSPCAYITCAADYATAERICTMVNVGRGLICAAIEEIRLKELGLPKMVARGDAESPDLAISVEARKGVSTGISASDRARTLRTLTRTKTPKLDLVTPGHIFPIMAKRGGVLVRAAAAEAAVDLLVFSGLPPVAALCQCLDENGDITKQEAFSSLAVAANMRFVKISEIIKSRLAAELVIEKIAEAALPTSCAGTFKACCFRSRIDGAEHLALIKGDLTQREPAHREPILARVQAEQGITDLLGTADSCGRQKITAALCRINDSGRGVFVYIRRGQTPFSSSSRGQESGLVTSLKEYGIGAQILRYLGAQCIRLLSNSEIDFNGLAAFQIEITERIAFTDKAGHYGSPG